MSAKNIIIIILVAEFFFLAWTISQERKHYEAEIENEEIIWEEITEEALTEAVEREKELTYKENNICNSVTFNVLYFDKHYKEPIENNVLDATINSDGFVNLSLKRIRELQSCQLLPNDCRIHSLNLSYNGLQSLPMVLEELKGLEYLYCPDNLITNMATIPTLKKLKYLDLSHNNITTVGALFSKMKHLEYLDLSNNFNLARLPKNIQQLENLETLYLSQTKLGKNKARIDVLKKLLPNTRIITDY